MAEMKDTCIEFVINIVKFSFESFKRKTAAVIFPYLIYNIVQMSKIDNVCLEKTCLSHMCDTSVCNHHMLSN